MTQQHAEDFQRGARAARLRLTPDRIADCLDAYACAHQIHREGLDYPDPLQSHLSAFRVSIADAEPVVTSLDAWLAGVWSTQYPNE